MSKRALASTPCVGSSISTTSASCRKLRASTVFCWLPPERPLIGLSSVGVAMLSSLDQRGGRARSLRRRDHSGRGELFEHLHRHVLADAERGKDRFLRAVGAERHDAGVERLARSAGLHLAAVAMEMAARRLQPAERAERLALPVALGAGEAENLAAVDVEVDVVEARRRSGRPPRSRRRRLRDRPARFAGYSASIGLPTISAIRSFSERLALTS